MAIHKIFNDPVYGFIRIPTGIILEIIEHPYFQRLQRIRQLGLTHFVYPGAVHTRFHHALGAFHLMTTALNVLREKGVHITSEEYEASQLAILLHDIGHGPFSHVLEHTLVPIHHEAITLMIMEQLNLEFEGQLTLAITIFKGQYHKQFLHQLISSQLDVDRLDYLTRDSFYTGVAEGVIGYDRLLLMIDVVDQQLVIEEKAIYSIEKFLISRRLMYWQVYLHKTVICAEKMLQKVLQRAVSVGARTPFPFLNIFLEGGDKLKAGVQQWLFEFCQLDDHDLMGAIKHWQMHEDKILSTLCRCLVERKLLKVKLQADPFDPVLVADKQKEVALALGITEAEAGYLVFTGVASNTTYDPADERINILFRDGSIKDISQVDNALVQHNLKDTVKKYYFCYWRV